MGRPWIAHRFPVGQRYKPMGRAWESHEIPVGIPWDTHEMPEKGAKNHP